MYTQEMARAFRSLDNRCPKGFSLEVIDNDDFLTIRVDPRQLVRLSWDDQVQATQYMFAVKNAFEMNGAIVLVVREALS